jgi:uncharacterized protein (TIGR02996 family)
MTADRTAGFLAAILAEPDAADHRLILADYLQDHGNPDRAEFIRLQVRLAHTRAEDDITWWADHDRAQALLARHEEEWTGAVKPLVRESSFRRGFVEHVTLSARRFLEEGERLFELAPVREVCLREVSASASQLFASPLLRRLRSLDLSNSFFGEQAIARLCESPHLERLEALHLGYDRISVTGQRRLLHARNLPALRELNLSGNRPPISLDALEDGPLLAQLEALDVGINPLGDAGIHRLAALPTLARLRRLGLAGTNPGVTGVRRLVRSPHLTNVEELNLGNNRMHRERLDTLLNQCRLPRLRTLSLACCFLTQADLGLLATTDRLPGVKRLSLDGNSQLDNGNLAALLTGNSFPALRCLDVRRCAFGDNLLSLLSPRRLRPLHGLELFAYNLSAEAQDRLRDLYPPGVVRIT